MFMQNYVHQKNQNRGMQTAYTRWCHMIRLSWHLSNLMNFLIAWNWN